MDENQKDENQMDENQMDEFCVTISFDDGNKIKLNKSFLMNHSLYFNAMFSGNFVESKSKQVQLKDINYQSFMRVIDSVNLHHIVFDHKEGSVEFDLLLILETSQLLQFTEIIKKSIELIEDRYVFTTYAVQIYSLASKLGLKSLFNKTRNYILYNFKFYLLHCMDYLKKSNEDDLLLLLNDNRLAVEKEIDVFNLVVDWCKGTNNSDLEYKIAMNCVRFNIMNTNQLQECISKTNDLNLQNYIKKYLNYTNQNLGCVGLLIRPVRSIPYVLCGVINDREGVYIYRWNWDVLRFTRFLKVQPLAPNTTGYNVIAKGCHIFVVAGEVCYGKGFWNESIWRYNVFTEKWKKIEDIKSCRRRHGLGHFCGDELYLMGGVTIHRLPNQEIERFKLENDDDKFYKVDIAYSYLNYGFKNDVNRSTYCCVEFKRRNKTHLALITKSINPMWHELFVDLRERPYYKWKINSMRLNATVLCAITYLNKIYILAYNQKNYIELILYSPLVQSCKKIKRFKTMYRFGATMCAFNVNKAMVFGNTTLEIYCIDSDTLTKHTIEADSFYLNYSFSIPIY